VNSHDLWLPGLVLAVFFIGGGALRTYATAAERRARAARRALIDRAREAHASGQTALSERVDRTAERDLGRPPTTEHGSND
jgi:hypothetical protein